MIFVVVGDECEVTLFPRCGAGASVAAPPSAGIQLKSNSVLLFRSDTLAYTFAPPVTGSFLVLAGWALAPPRELVLERLSAPGDAKDEVMGILTGPSMPRGDRTHI